MSARQAAARSDRPRGVRERQEAIRKRLRDVREEEEGRRRVEEEERVRVREDEEGEMGLGNWVQVVGGLRGNEVKAKKAKTKGKGKRGSFCGCL